MFFLFVCLSLAMGSVSVNPVSQYEVRHVSKGISMGSLGFPHSNQTTGP